MGYVLGMDLGTGSLKGLLVNRDGTVVASASSDYPMYSDFSGYSEQNPSDWVDAADKVIKQLISSKPEMLDKLEGISFSGQMHSLVVLNQDKGVLRKAILWNDVRTTMECKKITEELGDKLITVTKNRALEGFTLPKILWLQKNEPETWSKVRFMMLPKDYLGFWMTDTIHMDYSDAAGTLLLDVENKKWSQEMLSVFSIDSKIMPDLVESSDMIGTLKQDLKDLYGFNNDVKIFAGGADNACAALGAGIIKENLGMCSIGTSGVFLSYEATGKKDYQGKLHFFNHAVPNAFYSMGVTLSAGHSLTWFKNNFAKDLSYDELLSGIDQIDIGSDGLLFTPYIVGERTPYVDSKIRGSFIGLDTHHTQKHLAKSVLEGISFSLNDSLELMKTIANKKFDYIVSVGGGAKNSDWLQMQADIFNSKIVTLEVEQGPGIGAAMIAAVGVNWFDSFERCAEAFVVYDKEFTPIVENVEKYNDIYKIYRKVYESTKDICHELLK